MKSSFNKNSSAHDVMEFLSKTLSGAQNYQDALETVAVALLPALKANRKEMDAKARNIPAAYDMLTEDLDYEAISEKLTSIPESAVRAFVGSTSLGKPEDPLKYARQIKNQISSLSEDDYITLSAAFDSVLPPTLKAASEADLKGKTPAEGAREVRALAESLSEEEIARAVAERNKRLSQDQLAKGFYGLLQQCTPERVEGFVTYMNDNLGGAAVGLVVKRFWDFAEAALQAAEDGNFMQANPVKARAFGRALHDALTALDEGLQQTGFVLPKELAEFAGEAFDTRKLLRSAAAAKSGAEVRKGIENDITVRKFQVKKPGSFDL